MTHCGVQKGENRNNMYVFNTVMCLLFTDREINSNTLLLIIADFSLLMWNCPGSDLSLNLGFKINYEFIIHKSLIGTKSI